LRASGCCLLVSPWVPLKIKSKTRRNKLSHGETHVIPMTLVPSNPVLCCRGSFSFSHAIRVDETASWCGHSSRLRSSAVARLGARRTAGETLHRGQHSSLRDANARELRLVICSEFAGSPRTAESEAKVPLRNLLGHQVHKIHPPRHRRGGSPGKSIHSRKDQCPSKQHKAG